MIDYARQWGVVVDNTFETESSLIAFGSCSGTHRIQPVVLKVIKREGDEWRSGEILKSFGGKGVARVYEHAPGAVLLERLIPGNSLAEYEIGAMLRNPFESAGMFSLPATIERRIKQVTGTLNLDGDRVLAWGFAQAVLSAIWMFEDGFPVDAMNPALRLANTIKPMLGVMAQA